MNAFENLFKHCVSFSILTCPDILKFFILLAENDLNDDIITLKGMKCEKCGNPFKQTEGHVMINFTFPNQDSGSTTSYS